jgi:3-oxoacyl-[acyl-carrier-protein] synthase II
MQDHRVVVTGVGVVSPIGLDAPGTWEALVRGQSGVAPITLFDPAGQDVTFAAEVKDFEPGRYMDRKEARRSDRVIQFAVAASHEALEMAGLKITPDNADEIGVVIGSGIGGIMTLSEGFSTLHSKGPGRVSPFLAAMMLPDMPSGYVSIHFGARGPNYCVVSACSTGADAIGNAYDIVRRGDARAMLAGGAEASVTPIGIAAFAAARALSTRNDDPAHASRPFDRDRDGFVMGEGAGVLVLESLESARERGATILAELAGYGNAADAHHITQPAEGGEGGVRAMRLAARRAGITPDQIDYVNAHGTSTPMNDRFETMGLKTFFGERAYKVPISSTKSMIGHLLGAAGAVEAVFCVQAIRHGVIPPTINYQNPDPECDLDYVPNEAREAPVRVAITNSFGFGGHNASLVFRAVGE